MATDVKIKVNPDGINFVGPFNLNNYVAFKLSARGYKIIMDLPEMPEPGGDGYMRMRFWQFINAFGPYMVMGPASPFINNEIVLQENS